MPIGEPQSGENIRGKFAMYVVRSRKARSATDVQKGSVWRRSRGKDMKKRAMHGRIGIKLHIGKSDV